MKDLGVVFLADASELRGVGHVMRCLTLGRELRMAGAKVALFSANLPDRLKKRSDFFGIELVDLPVTRTTERVLAEFEARSPQVVVRDGYDYSDDLSVAICSGPWLSVALDDGVGTFLGNPEVIINPNAGASEIEYRRYGYQADLMLGLEYFCLRDEIREMKKVGYAQRSAGDCVLMFGGGKKPEYAGEIESLLCNSGLRPFSVPGFFDDQNWVAPLAVARAMAAASIAVTASGGSVWECAYLNTPAVAVPVAENQVAIAKKGEELGFAVVLQPDSPDFSTFLAKEVVELVKNDSKRSAMSRQSTGLIDGMGSKRVVRKILEKVTS